MEFEGHVPDILEFATDNADTDKGRRANGNQTSMLVLVVPRAHVYPK